jgi:hypothetical protein
VLQTLEQSLVFDELTDEPSQGRSRCVATSHNDKTCIGIELKWYVLVIGIEQMAEDVILWRRSLRPVSVYVSDM